jgi:hypothetical protein
MRARHPPVFCRSFGFSNPLQAVIGQNDVAQDFLGVANILEPGLGAGLFRASVA